jgi:hypothetical protein
MNKIGNWFEKRKLISCDKRVVFFCNFDNLKERSKYLTSLILLCMGGSIGPSPTRFRPDIHASLGKSPCIRDGTPFSPTSRLLSITSSKGQISSIGPIE